MSEVNYSVKRTITIEGEGQEPQSLSKADFGRVALWIGGAIVLVLGIVAITLGR
jgi:hypothetical protein